jgi:hypothetical protein
MQMRYPDVLEIVRDHCPQTYLLLEYLKCGPGAKCTKRTHGIAILMKIRPYIVKGSKYRENRELINIVKATFHPT